MPSNPWPHDTREALDAFYGPHILGPEGKPTARWEDANLVRFDAPYVMRLSWDLEKRVTRVWCHRRVADSLQSILMEIGRLYGNDPARLAAARMDRWGGCYEYRPVKGTTRLSTHAWGAGIDLDPANNTKGKRWRDGAGMMPVAVIEIFDRHRWRHGRTWRTPDAMHFQAAR